jgi:peroxiredoxin
LHSKLSGQRLPRAQLCEMVEGQLRVLEAGPIFGRGLVLLVGMPGAYTPICAGRHLPSLPKSADRLRAGGVTEIACIVTSSPFAVDAWAKAADPARKVRFLSYGNLFLSRALGLTTQEEDLFMGECSKRYLLTVRDGAIETVRVEAIILDLSCTNPDELVLD